MADYYMNPATGSSSNAGTSWGAAKQWMDQFSASDLTRVKIAKTPNPTLLGNVTWTQRNVDLVSSKSITGATNATPIVYTSNGHGFSNGDIVVITGITGNTNANGIIKVQNATTNTFEGEGTAGNSSYTSGGTAYKMTWGVLRLPTGCIKEILPTNSVYYQWTAANSASQSSTASNKFIGKNTCANSTTMYGLQTPGSGIATNTKYGYIDLGSQIDFSAYQQISFAIYTGQTTSANQFVIKLCSDATGDTPVNSFTIDAIPQATSWYFLNYDNGSALGGNIRSIAIYSGSVAPGTNRTIYINNLIACKAPSVAGAITHNSEISKNSSHRGTEAWYSIGEFLEFSGEVIGLLDTYHSWNMATNYQIGYSGTTETVSTYIRQPFQTALVNNSTVAQPWAKDGTADNKIVFSGGWNPDTDEQDGETVFTGRGNSGYFLGSTGGKNHIKTERVSGVRYSNFSNYWTNSVYSAHNLCGTGSFAPAGQSYGNFIGIYEINNILGLTQSGPHASTIKTDIISMCNPAYIASGCTFSPLSAERMLIAGNAGVSLGANSIIQDATIEHNNLNNGFYLIASDATAYLKNVVNNHSTDTAWSVYGTIYIDDYDGTPGDTRILNSIFDAKIQSTTSRTGSAWQVNITNQFCRGYAPADLPVAQIAVAANSLVTITAYLKKSHATNHEAQLLVKGGQVAGVDSDVVATMTDQSTDFEQVTLTFTPTAAGVVEVLFRSFLKNGSTTPSYSAFIDDIDFSQV